MFEGAPQRLEDVLSRAESGGPQPFDLAFEAELDVVTRHERVESPNVIGQRRGSDPELRDEYVVYSAHLDHVGIGEPVDGDAIYNGAMDNAVWTAVMIEIAHAFATLEEPPRRSVLFLAVTGEGEGTPRLGLLHVSPHRPPGADSGQPQPGCRTGNARAPRDHSHRRRALQPCPTSSSVSRHKWTSASAPTPSQKKCSSSGAISTASCAGAYPPSS